MWSVPHRVTGVQNGKRAARHLAARPSPPHVIPAHAGTHPDVSNPGPGSGGPVGRRDRHGDDVGWVSG